MDTAEHYVGLFVLAFLRYLPPVALSALTPLRWAPPLVRTMLALGLAWLTMLTGPVEASNRLAQSGGLAWGIAAFGELSVGTVFGLAVMMPMAAIHTSGWLVDIQAGVGAATLFNPGAQGDTQSLFGTALGLLATVLFFSLDLHLELYRLLVASAYALPVGEISVHWDLAAFLGLLGSSFLLGLVITAPVVLGLWSVDIAVAYATRSMPQANVYFLALPLKMLIALLLMAALMPYVPALLERLYGDAFARAPVMLVD